MGARPPRAQSEPSVITSQRSRNSWTFFWRSRPAMILSTVSTPRVDPIRHGVHLPQLSLAQNSIAKRAWRAMSTLSSKTTIPPWPSIPPAAAIELVVERRIEERLGKIGAKRATDLDGSDRPTGACAAAEAFDQFAQSRAEGEFDESTVANVAGKLERLRSERPSDAVGGVGLRAVLKNPRRGGEAQHIVDDCRLAEQP